MTIIEPDVVRRHVPMDEASFVEMSQPAAELTPETQNVIE